jgi:hypothetical protein
MTNFDLTLSFDTAEYLNPQLFMLISTLKNNVPKDAVIHITTNRKDKDPVIKEFTDNFKCYIYNREPHTDLKSRCEYMFYCFDIDTAKDWVIKIEADLLALKNLNEFDKILKPEYDLVIEPENRRIFTDVMEQKLWRLIYKKMGIKTPTEKITYRENNEQGLPLYGTGLVCIKSKHLSKINRRWIPLTKICEEWIDYNIHPNEFAFTALALDEKWNTYLYPPKYKFNPIGHFRKGQFPSIDLVEDCVLPEDTVIFDYHRPEWLLHTAKYNNNINEIIKRNKDFIPNEWWDLKSNVFMEK